MSNIVLTFFFNKQLALPLLMQIFQYSIYNTLVSFEAYVKLFIKIPGKQCSIYCDFTDTYKQYVIIMCTSVQSLRFENNQVMSSAHPNFKMMNKVKAN